MTHEEIDKMAAFSKSFRDNYAKIRWKSKKRSKRIVSSPYFLDGYSEFFKSQGQLQGYIEATKKRIEAGD
jgi:hypothetical protein